jgi:hypothetical protein
VSKEVIVKAKNVVLPIPLTSIDTSTFTGAYQVINTTGLPEACFMIRITNDSDRDATISFDGVHDHDFSIMGSTGQIYTSNEGNRSNFAKLIKIYVKGLANGTGSIYLSGYYRPQSY